MGTNNGKSESEALVKRCEAVGWQVSRTGVGHWKVDTRKGIFTIPSTPSDPRSMANSLAEARRRGLEELEAKLIRNEDRDRLRRIQEDRNANDAKLARMTEKVRQFSQTGQVEFREPTTADPTVDLGFGHVNGIAIVAIAPAMVKTPVMTGEAAPMADAEELLLANEAIVYRCRKKGPWGTNDDVLPGQFCNSVFSAARSLQVHISFHTRRAAKDSMTALNAADQEKERSVNEVIRKTNAAEAAVAVIAPTLTTDALKARLTDSLTRLVAAHDAIGAKVIESRNELLQLVDLVRDLRPEIVVSEPDPELVAKAAQFDQLAATLGSLIKPVK